MDTLLQRKQNLIENIKSEMGSSEQDLLDELLEVVDEMNSNKSIQIHFSEEDLQELLAGETFDWEFDGVECHLYMGDEPE